MKKEIIYIEKETSKTGKFLNYSGQIITLVIAIVTILYTVWNNNREQLDFTARLRPYLIVDNIQISNSNPSLGEVLVDLKNTGNIPAIIVGTSTLDCVQVENNVHSTISDMAKDVIGSGDSVAVPYRLGVIIQINNIKCDFRVDYRSPIDEIITTYHTYVTFSHTTNPSQITIQDAQIK